MIPDPTPSSPFTRDVVVIGGCGHVGLPLGIAFALAGLRVAALDINPRTVETVRSGTVPFDEDGAEERLQKVLADGSFEATLDPATIATAEHVVVVIGTPVGAHLDPDPQAVYRALFEVADHLRDGQLIVLRSTIFPGVTRFVERHLADSGKQVEVAFCPERILQGKAFTELHALPQIVSGRTDAAVERASRLFAHLADEIVVASPEEAELAKLFTNTWRYIKFAAANQFYMMANNYGLDYENIRHAMSHNYPRAADLPGAGFAAGPCLFKDTMQLAAFHNNEFTLGQSAMLVNEGLPHYVVSHLERRFPLADMTVGILGMAFKPESDDYRNSLSYKLKRILRFKAREVLTTDPYVTTDTHLVPLGTVLAKADLLIIATPHGIYRDIDSMVPVVDISNLRGNGVRI